MRISRRTTLLLSAVALTAASLTGCSAVSGLSKVASCSRLATAGSELKDALDGLDTSTDPSATLTTVTKATDHFDSQMKDVRDAEVKRRAEAVTSALRSFITDLKSTSGMSAAGAETALQADETAVLDAAAKAKAACE